MAVNDPVVPPVTPPTDPVVPPVTPPTDPVSATAEEEWAKTDSGAYKALVAERTHRKAAEARAKDTDKLRDQLKVIEDRDKTDNEKLQEERDALKVDNEKLKIENLRRDVAAEKGIDPKAAKYLQGSTREEMETAADEFAELLKPGKPVFGEVGQGKKGDPPAGRIYTNEELQDSAFFKTHQADIMRAQKEGRIKTD
jgi:hypothetical protein